MVAGSLSASNSAAARLARSLGDCEDREDREDTDRPRYIEKRTSRELFL